MFGKRKTAVEEVEPPVPTEAEALGRAKKAEARIAEANRKLRAFNAKHFLNSDWGLLVISGTTREEVDRQGFPLVVERDEALSEFSAALAEWARLKTGKA